MTFNLQEFAHEVYSTNVKNEWDVVVPIDWEDLPDKINSKLMLVVTELAEATEAIRHDNLENFVEELADAIIRILDITEGLDMTDALETWLVSKLDKNKRRGPRHGGKRI